MIYPLPKPAARHTEEQEDHSPVVPMNAPVEQPQPETLCSTPELDETRLRGASAGERGLFDVLYVLDPKAQTVFLHRFKKEFEQRLRIYRLCAPLGEDAENVLIEKTTPEVALLKDGRQNFSTANTAALLCLAQKPMTAAVRITVHLAVGQLQTPADGR